MGKFRITVTRTDEYEIEVNEKIYTKKELEEWGKHFHHVSDVEDLAKSLAISLTRQGTDYGFIEGYGYIKSFSRTGRAISHWRNGKKGLQQVPDKEYDKGIQVRIITEDFDYEAESESIEKFTPFEKSRI